MSPIRSSMKESQPIPFDSRLRHAHAFAEGPFPERQCTLSDTGQSERYQELPNPRLVSSELPFEFRGGFNDQYDAPTNGLPDDTIPTFGIDDIGTLLATSHPKHMQTHAGQCPGSSQILANSAELVSQTIEQRLEWQRAGVQYNLPPQPARSEGSMPSIQLPQHSTETTRSVSQYAPFSAVFRDSDAARAFRKQGTRFNRKPYRPPESDPSIEDLAQRRQTQVQRIYEAMTRGDAAKDNGGSIAMRRWAHSAFYPAELVEAHAHKVFDCLLEQAREGFRGWHHNDYASDDRKGEPEDKDVSCAERLDNIVQALEQEKTICEDIMASACQIRMFVNAPRAYARRKEANRHGNSKRGKIAATATPSSRVSKSRRATASRSRQATPFSACSPKAQNILQGLDQHISNQQPQPQLPYYLPGSAPAVSSAVSHYLAARPMSFTAQSDSRISVNNAQPMRQVTMMSRFEPHASSARFPSMPTQREPPLPQSYQTPEHPLSIPHANQKAPDEFSGASWPAADTFGGLPDCDYPPQETGFDSSLWCMDNFEFSPQITDHVAPYGEEPNTVHPDEVNIDPSLSTY